MAIHTEPRKTEEVVMFKMRGVTHWSIGVNDLTEAESFYRDVLGMEYRGRLGSSKMAAFAIGTHNILLCERREPLQRTQEQDNRLHHAFELEPQEWEEAARTLHAKGIAPAEPIIYREEGFFPGRELFVIDPSGNRIELNDPTWRPGMPRPSFEEIVGAPAAAG